MRRAAARKAAPAEILPPAFGEMPMADLGPRQCRFACTSDTAATHLFCGRRTTIQTGNLHGSWCDEHLPVIWDKSRRGPRAFPVPIRRKS